MNRIWKAIESLGNASPVAPQAAGVVPDEAPTKSEATRVKKALIAPVTGGRREGSKTEVVLELLKQRGGATLHAIMDATGWQAHSVRGLISGTQKRKMGLTIVSSKGESGERTYSINA